MERQMFFTLWGQCYESMEGVLSSSGSRDWIVCYFWNICCVSPFALVAIKALIALVGDMGRFFWRNFASDVGSILMICVQIRCLMFLWLIIRSVFYLGSTWLTWSVALTPKEFIAEEAFLLPNSPSVETVVHSHGLSMTRKYGVCSRLWILCPFLPKEMRWWKELVFMQTVRKNSSPDIEFHLAE